MYVCPYCTKEFQAQKKCDRCKGECLPIAEDVLDKAPLRDLFHGLNVADAEHFMLIDTPGYIFDTLRNIAADHPEPEVASWLLSQLDWLEKELEGGAS